MEIGYDIERVRRLARATAEAAGHLASLGSDDPATQQALDAVRLTRRNLEDHWLPLLGQILASRALLSWSATGPVPARAGPRRSGGIGPGQRQGERRRQDEQLLDELLLALYDLTSHDPADRPTEPELTALAARLAECAHRSDAVVERLVELARLTPALALLIGHAEFPHDVTVAALAGALTAAEPVGAVGTRLHLESITAAMSALLDDPQAALDVLLSPGTVTALGTWELLDDDLVSDFVVTGLHDAVAADPQRRADGYRVITELTRLGRTEFDGGMQPGLARGVAVSMVGYVDTLAPAIRREGDHEVLVILDGHEAAVGTYDEVADLFGAILRDPEAQVSMGIAAGAYAAAVVEERGAEVVRGTRLARVTRFADLLGDATRQEQAELTVAAAASEAARRELGGLIGFGLGAGLTATGAGPLVRAATAAVVDTVVDGVVEAATDRLAGVDPTTMPGRPIPSAIYDVVTTSAISLVVRRPELRRPLGLGAVTRAQWRDLAGRLADVAGTDDPRVRAREVLRLERHVEDELPDVDHFLREVRDVENLDELTEDRGPTDGD